MLLSVHCATKAGRLSEDYISVFELKVDVQVLHGEKNAPGVSRPFGVFWFHSYHKHGSNLAFELWQVIQS